MKTFNDLAFYMHPLYKGIATRCFFDNGYGVSVVKHENSYGGNKGLFELAVLEGTAENFVITYSTGITEDVLGNLSEADVTEQMIKVQNLPSIK